MQAYETVDDFFPEADALRAEIDAHFSDPYAHAAERHQIWNYWYVPEHYTYLRTDPRKVFSQPLFDRFFEHLQAEVFERWGLAHVTHPYLSVYVAGCHQALHNDALAGQMGYVVSLTRWDERRFSGGETLIFREEPYFGDAAMTRAAGARKFYDLVPADFNRLLVFDDRIPHGVQRIEGSMNPFEGRIVLHGHLSAGQPEVEGPLAEPTHTPRMIDLVADYMKR
ncbi:MAG: hypothetical protein R3C52_15925, partial [Hyphomonadaceae bacterium]